MISDERLKHIADRFDETSELAQMARDLLDRRAKEREAGVAASEGDLSTRLAALEGKLSGMAEAVSARLEVLERRTPVPTQASDKAAFDLATLEERVARLEAWSKASNPATRPEHLRTVLDNFIAWSLRAEDRITALERRAK